MPIASTAIELTEQGLLPDVVVRAGIRALLRRRLRDIEAGDAERSAERTQDFVRSMSGSVAALHPDLANAQHYELPAEFYGLVLGPHRKYSCCRWAPGTTTLADAEAAALRETCARAGLADGQTILELGCGWGSLTLWIARHYPASRIVAVSNSHNQRRHILAEASRLGLGNVSVMTCDMNEFDVASRFDRIVSVEMFEHMRNWRDLFARVAAWLVPGGRFFMHVFVHRAVPYAFEDAGTDDWMSRHFFSGGMMPSDDLALHFQEELHLLRRWRWDGTHYQRTANAWLANLDARRTEVLTLLTVGHGALEGARRLNRWRVFFMACAELFGHAAGREWWVSHYLFERPER